MSICVEQLPIRHLRPFAECVWYSDPTNETKFDIVPDGCVDVCFVLSEKRPRVLLFGTTTRTRVYDLEAGTPYFGVRFHPGHASLFVKERISELTDTQFEIPAFRGLAAEELLELKPFHLRKARLESELLDAVSQGAPAATGVIGCALTQINHRNGDLRMRDLAAFCNLSERQLERLFLEKVGIAPKLYARIRRFRSVLDCLEDPASFESPKLADVAASFGYTDQSHMARDFRNFSHSLSVPA